MDIKQITEKLNSFNEEEILTPQVVRDLLNQATLDDYEIEDDEKVVQKQITPGNYPIIGLEYDDVYLITSGDYKNYINDISIEFTSCLPDGIDDFFNSNEFEQYMNKDFTYIHQAVEFINKVKDEDFEKYDIVGDCTYNGVEYIAIKEIY